MQVDLISPKTRELVREYFVGTSLRVIRDKFAAARIAVDEEFQPPVGGQRRSLVEQHYHTMDFGRPADVSKFLVLCEGILEEVEEHAESPLNDATRLREWSRRLQRALERDGYSYDGGRLIGRTNSGGGLHLIGVASRVDATYVRSQVRRIEEAIEDDPRLAIGTSKELVETICKTVLLDRGQQLNASWDLLELVKHTRKLLQLTPEDIPDSARAAETVRKLLGNLAAVVHGIAELRNPYGTGHGPPGRQKGLQPRHARLCASAAIGLATFLLETHRERVEGNESK